MASKLYKLNFWIKTKIEQKRLEVAKMLSRLFVFSISEEAEYHHRLRKFFQTPTEIMEVFKFLVFSKDAPQLLFDGATKTTVCDTLNQISINFGQSFTSQ